MATHELKKLPKNTVEAVVTVPWEEVIKEYDHSFDDLAQKLEVPGFRPGKAPKNIAQKHIAKDKVYEEIVRHILPKLYEDLVKKEDIKPVVNPKIELVNAKENEPWQIKFTIAQKPTVTLGEYKKKIKDAKAGVKSADIWTPDKGGDEKQKPDEEVLKQKSLNAILEALIKNVPVEISPLIIEDEVNRRLAALVDDIHKMGLTVDSYLSSRNTTIDKLKEGFTKEIEDTYKLEFILAEIADAENVTVEKAEIDKLFSGIKEEKERKAAEANSYMYASIVRKQKTLEFLTNL